MAWADASVGVTSMCTGVAALEVNVCHLDESDLGAFPVSLVGFKIFAELLDDSLQCNELLRRKTEDIVL